MKQTFLSLALAALLFCSGTTSCKGKPKTEQETNSTQTTQSTAPVVISSDDSLRQSLPAVTKDFPGVTTTVNNGEVTLTGTIERDRLPTLMQGVQSLNVKKVNNNLTIK